MTINDDPFKDMTEAQPTEGDIVLNSRTETLYSHDFKNGEGKFINIITKDEGGTPGEMELELVDMLKETKGDFRLDDIKKIIYNEEVEKIIGAEKDKKD